MKPCTPAWIDETLRELTPHGTRRFPLQTYLSRYDAREAPGFPWHWHREIEIVYVARGEATALIGNERIPLAVGEGLLVPPGVIHAYEVTGSAEMPTLLFPPSLIAPEEDALYAQFVLPLLDGGFSFAALCAGVPWQAALLRRAAALYALAQPPQAEAVELEAHAAVCECWALLYRNRRELAKGGGAANASLTQARLRHMIAFLEDRYGERVLLRDIAQAASVSVSEVLRCFRAGEHATPMEYLNRLRLEQARARLTTTALSVTDVAAECGFSSVAYFDRAFRARYGVSPTACRRGET